MHDTGDGHIIRYINILRWILNNIVKPIALGHTSCSSMYSEMPKKINVSRFRGHGNCQKIMYQNYRTRKKVKKRI